MGDFTVLRPSSRHGLTYADAVQLLGAGDSPFISVLGRLAGVGAVAASAATLSAVDLFAVRDEVVNWGNQAVRRVRERLAGLSRYDRTQRLVAAHTVIVVTSFFEALGETFTAIGVDPGTVKFLLAEQVALGAKTTAEFHRARVLEHLVDNHVPLPSPAMPFEGLRTELDTYYSVLMGRVIFFLSNLLIGENEISEIEWYNRRPDLSPGVAAAALRRYETAYRSLAADVPEFAIWAAMTDAAAGRATTERIGAGLGQQLAELTTGLAGVRALLADLVTGNAVARRVDLASQYRLELDRPILDAGDLPDGVALPTTATLYVNPRARVRRAGWGSPIATEAWWADAVAVADVQPFLAGYLTGPEAVTAPLVVLGQPGSGKSLLSRVLAANLPPEDFLPVRVELRSVAADAPVQDQIETAVYQAIGERVNWPELVRSAGGALPVVILDGFDELLQASGVNRANYLEQVRDFQRREAELHRPLAVLVTSRIVVADRARVPEGSTVLRLDPFDDDQIGRWLNVWAATNTVGLAGRSLAPLSAGVALRYRELAEQPLLLLMLALYDALDNALQRATGGLGRADLYERLFTDFARREIGKREPTASADREPAAIASEIRRLELVALAMFTRGAQIVTEEQLDADLPELLGDDRIGSAGLQASNRPLTAAQLLVGRFFFIHESRAREGADAPERSFELLHATFGEFLVARLVVETLVDLVEERAHHARRHHPGTLDAGALYAWLSFAVLTGRAPIVEFCRALLARLSPDERANCRTLLLSLLRDAGFPHPTWSFANYRPTRHTVSARHAAFTANLVTLIVVLSPAGVDPAELFPWRPGASWRSHALLWESQLARDGWRSLWQTMRMTYHVRDDRVLRDAVRIRAEGQLKLEDGAPVTLSGSVPWPPVIVTTSSEAPDRPFGDLSVPADGTVGEWLREAAFRMDGDMARVLAHSLAPFWRYLAPEHVVVEDAYPPGTDTAALLELLLAPRVADRASVRRLKAAYTTCLELFRANDAVQALIMRTLEDDAVRVDPDVVLTVLSKAVDGAETGSHNYWTFNSESAARILATVYPRASDSERIRLVYLDFEGIVQLVNNPEEPPFRFWVEQAFARLGADFPKQLLR